MQTSRPLPRMPRGVKPQRAQAYARHAPRRTRCRTPRCSRWGAPTTGRRSWLDNRRRHCASPILRSTASHPSRVVGRSHPILTFASAAQISATLPSSVRCDAGRDAGSPSAGQADRTPTDPVRVASEGARTRPNEMSNSRGSRSATSTSKAIHELVCRPSNASRLRASPVSKSVSKNRVDSGRLG